MSSEDLRNTWTLLSKQYTEEYDQCIASIVTIEKAENFDYEGLCKALDLLSDFEKKANDREIESGVLKGVNVEDVKKVGGRLILQDGCSNFLQYVQQKEDLDVNLHVLSYCWCGDLIRSAFSSVDSALETMLSVARRHEPVTVSLHEALNRILVEEIRAPDPLPPYLASIKDGYAVVAAHGPGEYPVITESRAGNDGLGVCVTPGTVSYLTIGGMGEGVEDDIKAVQEEEEEGSDCSSNALRLPAIPCIF